MITEIETDVDKLEKFRKIHALIDECMLINQIEPKESLPAIFYHLLILLCAHKVSRKEVSRGLNMIKKYHSNSLDQEGL